MLEIRHDEITTYFSSTGAASAFPYGSDYETVEKVANDP
jgi:hypothetical protein